jgi:hypothetical protein
MWESTMLPTSVWLQEHIVKRDRTVCSNYDNHSILNIIGGGGPKDHLISNNNLINFDNEDIYYELQEL